MLQLNSAVDASVNFVEDQLIGFVESRYVRKTADYFICYLSSQTGCNRGCRFCHLTTTGQTRFADVDTDGFLEQAGHVFQHYDKDEPARYMHFNFMARGEPLTNATILHDSPNLLGWLGRTALSRNLFPKFNMSSIMPVTLKKSLTEIFPLITPTMYYSIYSVDPVWRKAWMPAAMAVDEALRQLRDYQDMTKKIVKFHGAFIAGENDGPEQVAAMLAEIERHGISGEFNIVRYNPASPEQGEESTRLSAVVSQISRVMPVKIIPRVGPDVKASCGVFYEEEAA
jgi:23S rRNA (adenine2503-C2)-methyltransferase